MMNKKEIVKLLRGNNIEITSAELKTLLPESYDYLRDLLVGFVEDETNKTTQKDLFDFDDGAYPIVLSFQDNIKYYAGHDIQNQPEWGYDSYEDINKEILEEILYFVICSKIDKVLEQEENIESYRIDIDEVPLKEEETGRVLANSAVSVWILWKENSEEYSPQSILHLFPGYSNSIVYYTKSGLSEKTAREINNIIKEGFHE